jgi:hypothetical protein
VADERKGKGETVVANLKEAKRLSSGVLASHGIHSLNDPRFLEAYNEKRKRVIEKAEQVADAKKERLHKKFKASWHYAKSMAMKKLTSSPTSR